MMKKTGGRKSRWTVPLKQKKRAYSTEKTSKRKNDVLKLGCGPTSFYVDPDRIRLFVLTAPDPKLLQDTKKSYK